MKVTERRIIRQDWYETEMTKTGWDSHGWIFDDGNVVSCDWVIVNHIHSDKYGNPFVGIAEREITLNQLFRRNKLK